MYIHRERERERERERDRIAASHRTVANPTERETRARHARGHMLLLYMFMNRLSLLEKRLFIWSSTVYRSMPVLKERNLKFV